MWNEPHGILIGQWHSLRSLESGTMLLECKDVPWEPLGEADILKFDNYKIS